MKRTPKVLVKNYLFILLGSFLYALAFDWCFVPNGIAFGGVTVSPRSSTFSSP